MINQAPRHEGICGSAYVDPYYLDLGNSGR
jgi:hypothetical protein